MACMQELCVCREQLCCGLEEGLPIGTALRERTGIGTVLLCVVIQLCTDM